MPIRWKLILGIGAPLVVLMSVLLVLDYRRLRALAIEQAEQRVTEIALRHAAQYQGLFDTVAQVARTGAAVIGQHSDLTEAEIYELLRDNVQRNDLVYGSCIGFEPGAFRRKDEGVASSIPEAPRERSQPGPGKFAPYVYRGPSGIERLDIAQVYDYSDGSWEWYDTPRWTQSDHWTDPYFDKDAGNVPMITFSAPIKRAGTFIGVVTVDVQLEKLRRVSMRDSPKATALYILDRQGRFLLAPVSMQIMSDTVFQQAARMNAPELDAISRRAMRGESGVGIYYDPDLEQREMVYFAPIKGTGWSLGCVSPENFFLGEQMAALRDRAAVGAAVVVIILAFVAFMGAWIVRPVGRLAEAVRELGSGNLSPTRVRAKGSDEIGQLARGFNTMVDELRRHVDALTRETAALQAVESELAIARTIQGSMLPRTFPPFPDRDEFELHAVSIPARQVGGDFFDFFFAADNQLTVVVADVSGKGVPAAIFMAVARTVVRDLASGGRRSPGEIMNEANELLVRENSESMFVTMQVGQYDPRSGVLRYANAGHPGAYILDRAGKLRPCAAATGTVLGVIPGARFEDGTESLRPGERIVFYTDGVPEARSPGGEFYRAARFEAVLGTLGHETAQAICDRSMAEVAAFQNGAAHDDITLLVLGRLH